MQTFIKNVDKMTAREMRLELKATRKIIDDIYTLTNRPHPKTLLGMKSLLNQVAHYCCRKMP